MIMNTIVCGSKKYHNTTMDSIVDKFDIIVRNNMLLPNMTYGKRDPSIQVCNCHVYDNMITKKKSIEELHKLYEEKTSLEHIKKFYEFCQKTKAKFVHYPSNNSSSMRHIISKYNLENFVGGSLLKCGMSHVAECISNDIKPFVIGFSLQEEHLKQHACNRHKKLYDGHNHGGEIKLLISLHQKKLIDASFCLIEDKKELSFSNHFEPTDEALEILKC
tara:strand:+ start:284 stop:937 length:654 start_codon:yes stop_codon:yes gene_type:complete